jgi:hypothetical protein
MSFPVSPANGAFTTINGITYTYSSSNNSWTVYTSNVSFTSNSAPTSPTLGSFWYQGNTDILFTYVKDANNNQFWLDISGAAGSTTVTTTASTTKSTAFAYIFG